MSVRRDFGDAQGVSLFTTSFAQCVSAAHMNWSATAQVGEREIDPAIAAERGAEQRKKRLVLIDGQQLPIAESPPHWGEIKAHEADFGKEGFGHGSGPVKSDARGLTTRREYALQSDAEIEREVGLHVVVRLVPAARSQCLGGCQG